MSTYERNTFYGDRDIALLYFMLDTGVRAFEPLALNLSDINLVTNQVEVRECKGHKHRTTYFGKKTKKVLRAYLRHHNDKCHVGEEGPRTHDLLRTAGHPVLPFSTGRNE